MVTIEQKLTLFSKLLQQDIRQELDDKAVALEEEYRSKVEKSKLKADRQAEEIIAQAIKKGEAKKVELISKGKMATKRENMLAKEKHICTFMDHLKERIIAFTQTENYCRYLDRCLVQCESLKDYTNLLMIYITAYDKENHQDYIMKKLEAIGVNKNKLRFEVSEKDILGGFIIDDPQLNMRMDFSISGLLEDNKNQIIETIFKAIGEAGGPVE